MFFVILGNIKEYEEELNIINYIAQANGYKITEIKHVHDKVKERLKEGGRKDIEEQQTEDVKIYSSIEYHEKLENVCQNTFKRYKCTLPFRTNNKLGTKITKNI